MTNIKGFQPILESYEVAACHVFFQSVRVCAVLLRRLYVYGVCPSGCAEVISITQARRPGPRGWHHHHDDDTSLSQDILPDQGAVLVESISLIQC